MAGPIYDSADSEAVPEGRLARETAARRSAERALLECEEKYRNVVSHAKAGIAILQERVFKYANNRLGEILGLTPEALLGSPFLERVAAAELPRVDARILRFDSHSECDQRFETILVQPSGRSIDAEITLSMTHFNGRRAALVMIYDISDQKRAEEHIHLLSQQLIQAQENERARISRELHDKVAQDLSSMVIACETLFDGESAVSDRIRERAADLTRTLQDSIADVRDLAYDLRPPGLDKLGLATTIFLYCEDYQKRTGIAVDFYAAGMEDLTLDFDSTINLYRLIQEALRNVEKHAGARHVTLRLVASSPNIVLRVADDGRGFDMIDRLAAVRREKRMGLKSMEERVRLLGGEMGIQSRPLEGTRLHIEVPIREKARGKRAPHTHR